MWHKLQVRCPDCHKEITILDIYTNSEGEFGIDGICVQCGQGISTEPINAQKQFSIDAVLDYLSTDEGQLAELERMPTSGKPC